MQKMGGGEYVGSKPNMACKGEEKGKKEEGRRFGSHQLAVVQVSQGRRDQKGKGSIPLVRRGKKNHNPRQNEGPGTILRD